MRKSRYENRRDSELRLLKDVSVVKFFFIADSSLANQGTVNKKEKCREILYKVNLHFKKSRFRNVSNFKTQQLPVESLLTFPA